MVGVINSVLLGTVAGFGAAAITDSLWPAILVAVIVFGIATIVHQRYQLHARHRKPDPFAGAPPP